MMMNVLHLLWILPVTIVLSVLFTALFVSGKGN